MRRNLAAARLSILKELEYRTNLVIDAIIQPVVTSGIEVALWSTILSGVSGGQLGGYGRESYLAYALWATFLGRLTANWSYEFIMLDEIDSGRINTILTRPISFYEFYLSQFVGYKGVVALASFVFPLGASLIFNVPFHPERAPIVLLSCLYYLVFVHTTSFLVACLAFFMSRAQSFTGIKNLAIWVLAGELIPLDLYPEPLKTWLIHSPFASGVYVPVGYLTGRFGPELMMQSFMSVTGGILVVGSLAAILWKRGLRVYTGTGA